MEIEEIKRKVIKKIKPSDFEKRKVDKFLIELKEVAKIISSPYGTPVICGSLGKGTWIRKSYDIDLFIVFPKTISRQKLEEIGLEIGKKIVEKLNGEWIIKYAEHPYVRGHINEFDIDIVPCYEMKFGEKIKSAVDRSPLHTIYVINNLNEKGRDEVRLLKKFFKSLKLYGSDTKTEGISGYILELLVIKFGSFENVLSFFSKADFGEVIDIENYWKSKLPKKMTNNYPLVVVDPTDKYRNASAALSSHNFYLIKKYSKEFLKSPSYNMFFMKEKNLSDKDINKLLSRGTYFISIVFKRPDIIDDTLYPQMRKTSSRLSSIFNSYGFSTIRNLSIANENNCVMIFELNSNKLPKIEKWVGPNVFSKIHSKRFLEKYSDKELYIENNKWIVEKERKFDEPKKIINYIKNMNKTSIEQMGIASHISEIFQKVTVMDGKSMWDFLKKEFGKEVRRFYFGL